MKFEHTFMISALSGDGVDDLRATLPKWCRRAVSLPEDQMSDAPMRHLAAEITREKIFRQLHQELPYQSTVETDSWTERKDKSVRIEQTIFVERESQRKIVLGKGGATIKSIGADSRKEIAEIVAFPCTCSCSSRCARTGATTPTATGKWDWNSPKNNQAIIKQ
jgi:GTPase